MMGQARLRPSEPIQRLPIAVKSLRWGLFLVTTLSAAAALFAEPLLADAVERGRIDPLWKFIPLGCFVLFLSVYVVDRWFLVRRRSYPPGRAFFQIVFGVLFALLLLPSTLDDWRRTRAHAAEGRDERFLRHRDAGVRRIALEALGFRGPNLERLRAVLRGLNDPAVSVANAAAQVLSAWSGLPADEREALSAWGRRQLNKPAQASGAD